MKKFKVSYPYPLEHPIKAVIQKPGLLGLVGWLYQKYGTRAKWSDFVVSERIVEVPTAHAWIGSLFKKPTGTILEIGHVASAFSVELASLGYRVFGIDLRGYSFHHPQLTSYVGDFLKYEFAGKLFDCVVSLSTIEHFGFSKRYGGHDTPNNTEDEQAFQKIARLLKPGGHAIISVPYAREWVPGIWFRCYTRKDIESKLSVPFTVVESRYYRRDNNEWTRVTDPQNDPLSPHDGCALFLLRKA